MPEEKKETPSRRKTRAKKSTAETQPEAAKASEPSKVAERKKPKVLATGLEDYGKWKAMFKNYKRKDDLPFRRGRIWS
ncbi:cyanobactin biosynthesis PatC/TenC/TruC family protein [Myxosarcina sp. GI1(2024)]